MSGKPVKIAILADSRDAVKGFDKASDAAKETGDRFDSVAESSDRVASKGAQAAGALSGLGDLVGGKFGAAMQTAGVAMQAAADSGDLLNVVTESNIVRKIKDTATTAAQTTATIAKTAADKAAALAARGWAAAQWVLNAAMSANPIGLVVVAIGLLVGAFAFAMTHSQKFREIVIGVWDKIKAATVAVWNFMSGLIKTVVSGIVVAVRFYFNTYKAIILGVWNAVRVATSAVWNGIRTAVTSTLSTVVSAITGLQGRITRAMSKAATWLVETGKDIVRGLISGIGKLAGDVTDALLNLLPGPLKKFASKLGIKSPSTLFRGYGENIGQGLVIGIDSMTSDVADAASRLASAAMLSSDGTLDGALTIDASAAFSASRNEKTTFEIRLSAQQMSQLLRGQALQGDLNAWRGVGGRVPA